MKIAIYSQHTGKYTNSILSELFGFSDKYNIKFYLEKEFANILNRGSNIKLDYTIFSSYKDLDKSFNCLLYTSPSPRDVEESRMPSSA